ATHWVMMGAYDNGGYYHPDVKFTESLKVEQKLTNEEIMNIHLDIIKERLTSNGLKGFIQHLNKKINYTCAEGTYFVPIKLNRNPIDENPYGEYIYGESRSVVVYFCQAVHINILGLIVVAGFKLFREKTSIEIVLSITLFGTFLFLLIWETRSRYLVLMLPVMMAMCTYAMCDKGREIKG
ncbi:MAG: hypothetical protein IJ085_08000, partial [Turicibacter sp.]|nr:hypothetical protein [Turicibacter sp.]